MPTETVPTGGLFLLDHGRVGVTKKKAFCFVSYRLTGVSYVMSQQSSTYPPVTEELLREVVRRIRGAGNPLKIILFGSRARGEARPDSDLDLLIVEESNLPCYRRSPPYYHALAGVFPSKDIVVYTPAEVADWSSVPNAFVTTVMREGRILYAYPG